MVEASLLQIAVVLTVNVRGTRSSRGRVTERTCMPRAQVSIAPDPEILTVDSVTLRMFIYAYPEAFSRTCSVMGGVVEGNFVAAAREGPDARLRTKSVSKVP